jgi:hypothetical protein
LNKIIFEHKPFGTKSFFNKINFEQIRKGVSEVSTDPADGEGADLKITTTSTIWREILSQVKTGKTGRNW